MKRVAIAIISGLIFPIAYTILVGLISEIFPQYVPDIQLFGQAAPNLVFAPTLHAIYFCQWLAFNQYFGYGLFLNNFFFRISLLILSNIVLYSSLTYLILYLLKLPRKSATNGSKRPPLPPTEWN